MQKICSKTFEDRVIKYRSKTNTQKITAHLWTIANQIISQHIKKLVICQVLLIAVGTEEIMKVSSLDRNSENKIPLKYHSKTYANQ